MRFEPLEDRHLLATFTVDTPVDILDNADGLTSLREAIASANATTTADTINFATSLTAAGPASIVLTQGQLLISRSLTINGPGAALLTIDASGSDPTPDVNNGDGTRIFHLSASFAITVEIDGLRLTGADTTSGGTIDGTATLTLKNVVVEQNNGGGILLEGNTSITGSTFQDNVTVGNGGALSVHGTLSIVNSTITRNTAGELSGGIDSWGGSTFFMDNCIVTFNTARNGGGLQTAHRTVEIRNSTISNNRAIGGQQGGGGLLDREGWGSPESLTIASSTISDNVSETTAFGTVVRGGGGVLNESRITSITGSVIIGNTASGTLADGGGLLASSVGTLVGISNTRIENNVASRWGGGLLSRYSASLTDSTISGNQTGDQGGGVHTGTATLIRSRVLDNHTTGASAHGGGIFAASPTTITDSTISDNYTESDQAKGGGLYSLVQGNSAVTITRSTISGNHTAGANADGGGLFLRGGLRLLDSTVSGNLTLGEGADGGGVFANSIYALRSTTALNNVSGVNSLGGGFVATMINLVGSIVALNSAAGSGPDVSSQFTVSSSYSLVGDTSGAPSFLGAGNLLNQNPLLAPLANNGGLTQTHALLPGSPAIDTGVAASPPQYDQRGTPFNRRFDGDGDSFARVDMGALESQPNPLPGDYNYNRAVDSADYALWRDTLNSTNILNADGNGNGIVDQADYDVWLAHFGQMLPMGAGASGEERAASVELGGKVESPQQVDSSRPLSEPEVSGVARPGASSDGRGVLAFDALTPRPSLGALSVPPENATRLSTDALLLAYFDTHSHEHASDARTLSTSRTHHETTEEADDLTCDAIDQAFDALGANVDRRPL